MLAPTAALLLLLASGLSSADNCSLPPHDRFSLSCVYEDGQLQVHLQCQPRQQASDWASFPTDGLQLRRVGLLLLNGCALPVESSGLSDLLRQLNLSAVRELRLEKPRDGPTSQALSGLSLRSLHLQNAPLENPAADLLWGLSGLRALGLEDSGLASIPTRFFGDWATSLSNLTLMRNRLSSLVARDLHGLRRLQHLWLNNNRIALVEVGTFDELTALRSLDLSGNELSTLPAGLFTRLSGLEALHLGANRFDSLPGDLLTAIENARLQRFRMSANRGSMSSLPAGFFRGLGYLAFVELVRDGLFSLPADLFDGAVGLLSLDLSQNNLTTLPGSLFRDTSALVELRIEDGQLEWLPGGIFASLADLKKLYLNHNRLGNLSTQVLDGLIGLQLLEAAWNKLAYIGPNVSDHLLAIEELDVNHNRLTLDEDGLSALRNCMGLKVLKASHNRVQRIYGEWIFMLLERIELDHNEITTFGADELTILHEVTVYLRHNKISTIDLTELERKTEVYRKANVKYPNKGIVAYLGGNPLNCDCRMVDFFRYFENKMDSTVSGYIEIHANLTDDDMEVDFEGFECSSPLEFVDHSISDIKSEDLNCVVQPSDKEDACSELCSCREYTKNEELSVDCSHKNLTELPKYIANPRAWPIRLNMSANKLMQTPSLDVQSHPYLAFIDSLDLSANNISTVTLGVFSHNLQELLLHDNSISSLEESVIKHLSQEQVRINLTLHGNRWQCDCQARSFISLVQLKLDKSELQRSMCYESKRPLMELTADELCKHANQMIIAASLLVALLGLLLGILAALYYKYQREIKIWLYSKQWCLWFDIEDPLDQDKKYDAFISFSHKDEEFVEKEIVAQLEGGPRPFKLCLHYRDWLAGEWIPVQIRRSVQESRRTVVILSDNFLESVWGRMEFRAAHTQVLEEGRARLIVILYGDISSSIDELDPELKSYLSFNTYIKWGDPWFWEKLRYALSHRCEPSQPRKSRNARILENHLSQMPVNNVNNGANPTAKAEVIPMPKLLNSTNDSLKLLDSAAEDDRLVASC